MRDEQNQIDRKNTLQHAKCRVTNCMFHSKELSLIFLFYLSRNANENFNETNDLFYPVCEISARITTKLPLGKTGVLKHKNL